MKRSEIQKAIKSKDWQSFRLSLKGLSTRRKLMKLKSWSLKNEFSKDSKIQVENYINSLKRAGLL